MGGLPLRFRALLKTENESQENPAVHQKKRKKPPPHTSNTPQAPPNQSKDPKTQEKTKTPSYIHFLVPHQSTYGNAQETGLE